MNKQMCFFDTKVLVEPEFYNYILAFYNYPTTVL